MGWPRPTLRRFCPPAQATARRRGVGTLPRLALGTCRRSVVFVTLGNFDLAGHLVVMQIAAAGRMHDEIAADAVHGDVARTDRADFDIAAGAAYADVAGTDRFDVHCAFHVGEVHVAGADMANL